MTKQKKLEGRFLNIFFSSVDQTDDTSQIIIIIIIILGITLKTLI